MNRKLNILTIFYILTNILTAQDQGVENYRDENYKAAQKYYDSILSDDSESAEALFGKGSALFMQEELSQAESSFNATLPYSDNQLKSKAFYNLGNISFKNNKLDQALLFYKKALELNPKDDEARYNYEYIKYQKNPPEDEKDDEKKDDEKKDDEKKDDEKKDDENKDDEKKDNEKKDNEKKDDEKNSDEKKQQPQDEKKSQDLKKAESILEAIKNDEKVMQKQQIKRAKTKKLLKDW
ncbi:MAG: tetratricopeptide repeat protein [Candidatus Neomarinimicrobiota bacterium]|nr:tetratricopeptide repeat protein [Candidatus Neomarinimicrobiota bacterium]